MITLSINQLTVQLTIVQRNVNYQTMILPVSYKSSSIICIANDTISSAFPFEQHANPLTVYLPMIALSINQLTVQLTIVQRNVNYQSCKSPTNQAPELAQHFHDLASLLQIKQHYMHCK